MTRSQSWVDRQARVQQLKLDVSIGRYVVDLDLLANRLVDRASDRLHLHRLTGTAPTRGV